jgi:hypothetical protein
VETKYSWSSVAREFAAALEKVIADGKQNAGSRALTSSTAR